MCMTCVAQGGPYLLGSVVALRAMSTSARRKRSGRGATVRTTEPTGPPGRDEPLARVVAAGPTSPVSSG